MPRTVPDSPEKGLDSDVEATRKTPDRLNYPKIIGISAVLAALAYGGSYLLHPRYESTESLYFPMSNDDPSNPLSALKAGVRPGDPGSISLLGTALSSPEVGSSKDTALAILNSTSCLKQAIRENDLTRVYHEKESKALKTLQNRLAINVDKNGLIVMQVTDEDPQRAANILNSLRMGLETMSARLTVNVSHSNRVFIEQRVEKAHELYDRRKAALAQALQTLHYADAEAIKKRVIEMESRAEEARLKAESLRAQISKTEDNIKKSLVGSDDFAGEYVALNNLYPGLSAFLQELQRRKLASDDAASEFNKNSIPVQEARVNNTSSSDVAKSILRRRKQLMARGVDPSVLTNLASLNSLEVSATEYEHRVKVAKKAALEAPQQYVELQSRKRDFSIATEELNLLEKELELARIGEIRDPSRFEVVDAAEPADESVFPKRGLTAGVVFFLAFVGQIFPRLFASNSSDRGR